MTLEYWNIFIVRIFKYYKIIKNKKYLESLEIRTIFVVIIFNEKTTAIKILYVIINFYTNIREIRRMQMAVLSFNY